MQSDGVAGTEQHGGNGRADIPHPMHKHRRAFCFDHKPSPRYGKRLLRISAERCECFQKEILDLRAGVRPCAPRESR